MASLPTLSVQFAFLDATTGTAPAMFSLPQLSVTSSSGILVSTTCTAATALNTSTGVTLPVTSASGFSVSGGSASIIHAGTRYSITYTGTSGTNLTGVKAVTTGFTTSNNDICGISANFNVNQPGSVTLNSPFVSVAGTVTLTHGGMNYSIAYTNFQSASLGTYTFANALLTTVGQFTPGTSDSIVTWNWYETNAYVRDFTTKMGRQHELDRVEAGTLQLSLDNRDGRWYPWNTNSFSYTNLTTSGTTNFVPQNILTVGVPVRIVATWNSVSYPIWYGFVDSWEPASPDEVNTDVTVMATDVMKRLSLTRLSNATLYLDALTDPTAVYAAAGLGWSPDVWRCNDNPAFFYESNRLTNSGSAAVITSTGVTLSPTSNATINVIGSNSSSLPKSLPATGGTFVLNHEGGATYNVTYQSWTGSAGAFTFNNCNTTAGTVTLGWSDYIVGGTNYAMLYTATTTSASSIFQQAGVQAYDPSAGGLSLSAGTSTPSVAISALNYPSVTASANGYTIEAWVKNPQATSTWNSASVTNATSGDTLLGFILPASDNTGSNIAQYMVGVDPNGHARIINRTVGASATTDSLPAFSVTGIGPSLNDGNWHLVTFSVMYNGTTAKTLSLTFYVDGIFLGTFTTAASFNSFTPSAAYGTTLIGTTSLPLPAFTSVATIADCVMTADQNPYSLYPAGLFASLAWYRYMTATYMSSWTFSTTTAASATITKTATTLSVASTQGFNPYGGQAFIGLNQYPIQYTGILGNTLTGVTLGISSPVSTYTTNSTYGDSIWTVQPKTPGMKLMEAGIVAGLLPYDGTATLSSSPVALDPGIVPCANEPSTTFTTSLLDYSFQYTETEDGLYYQDPSGTLRFRNRFYPQKHTANLVQLSDANTTGTAHYMLGVETVIDDLDLWSIAQITSSTSGQTTYVQNQGAASTAQFGPRTYSRGQNWATRQADVTSLGSMIVNRYQTPKMRGRKIIFDNTYIDSTGATPNQPVMFGTNLWDQLVLNHDGYGTNFVSPMVVESIANDYKADPGTWQTTFIMSPYELNGSSTPNSSSFFALSAASGYPVGSWSTPYSQNTSGASLAVLTSTSSPASTGTLFWQVNGLTYSVNYSGVSAGSVYTTFTLSGTPSPGNVTIPANTTIFLGGFSNFQVAQGAVATAATVSTTGVPVQLVTPTAMGGLVPTGAQTVVPTSCPFPTGVTSVTMNHAGTNYAVTCTGRTQLSTTANGATVTLTTSSSVTLTLASVSNLPTGGGLFWIEPVVGQWAACSYAAVSGSTITGCKLLNTSVVSSLAVGPSSNYPVVSPATLTGCTVASGNVTFSAGDTVYYSTGTAQDTFGG